MHIRNLIATIIFCLFYQSAISQCCVWKERINCDTLNTEPERQFCWLALFNKNKLKYNSDTLYKYYKYNVGKSEAYLTGKDAPWGANDFENVNGGIANRWQGKAKIVQLKDTSSLKWSVVKRLTKQQIALLSPAEKLDIYLGNEDFPITKREMTLRGLLATDNSPNDGFCNGMRSAGALMPEPVKTIVARSKKGIDVTFYPADLKALAGASYLHLYDDTSYAQLGCPTNHADTCGPNPAVLDIALRFMIGRNKLAFFIDTAHNGHLVNQTIVGYSRKIKGMASSIHNGEEFRSIDIELTLYCLKSLPMAATNKATKPIIGDKNNVGKYPWLKAYIYRYKLFADKEGVLYDGRWTGSQMPDFVWFAVGLGGEDRQPARITNANSHLNTSVIRELVLRASK